MVEKDWRRRKYREALCIDSNNPQEEINPRKLMNPEKGTYIRKLEIVLLTHSRNKKEKTSKKITLHRKANFSKEYKLTKAMTSPVIV